MLYPPSLHSHHQIPRKESQEKGSKCFQSVSLCPKKRWKHRMTWTQKRDYYPNLQRATRKLHRMVPLLIQEDHGQLTSAQPSQRKQERGLRQLAGQSLSCHLQRTSISLCPYHNPTMGLSVDNGDIRKTLAHTTPYTLSAICSVQLKPGLIHEEHTSPACQWPSKHVVIFDHSYSLSDPCAVKAQLFKALDTNKWLNRRLQMKSQLINKMRFKLKAARAELSGLRSWQNLARAAGKVSIRPSVQRIVVNDIS
ncbi:uncharacterized protein isoform X1 [Salmo salar]|uniref:Uncharacterized protein LOC106567262 isoform X1 n=1 Tax=Salmo salar TaxID=8030 RepID=A0ABM3CRF1_SALSA|nr:uncharacterized protein LOC106567262 isoform X1 [Salmo salar]XP_045549136.1 uncharacterized protein LOC106567262 isoform X1 [Salmo salar]XP_045549137.1 uncharacterized protein LOC106567262 isoform X1 [Salmo salar]